MANALTVTRNDGVDFQTTGSIPRFNQLASSMSLLIDDLKNKQKGSLSIGDQSFTSLEMTQIALAAAHPDTLAPALKSKVDAVGGVEKFFAVVDDVLAAAKGKVPENGTTRRDLLVPVLDQGASARVDFDRRGSPPAPAKSSALPPPGTATKKVDPEQKQLLADVKRDWRNYGKVPDALLKDPLISSAAVFGMMSSLEQQLSPEDFEKIDAADLERLISHERCPTEPLGSLALPAVAAVLIDVYPHSWQALPNALLDDPATWKAWLSSGAHENLPIGIADHLVPALNADHSLVEALTPEAAGQPGVAKFLGTYLWRDWTRWDDLSADVIKSNPIDPGSGKKLSDLVLDSLLIRYPDLASSRGELERCLFEPRCPSSVAWPASDESKAHMAAALKWWFPNSAPSKLPTELQANPDTFLAYADMSPDLSQSQIARDLAALPAEDRAALAKDCARCRIYSFERFGNIATLRKIIGDKIPEYQEDDGRPVAYVVGPRYDHNGVFAQPHLIDDFYARGYRVVYSEVGSDKEFIDVFRDAGHRFGPKKAEALIICGHGRRDITQFGPTSEPGDDTLDVEDAGDVKTWNLRGTLADNAVVGMFSCDTGESEYDAKRSPKRPLNNAAAVRDMFSGGPSNQRGPRVFAPGWGATTLVMDFDGNGKPSGAHFQAGCPVYTAAS